MASRVRESAGIDAGFYLLGFWVLDSSSRSSGKDMSPFGHTIPLKDGVIADHRLNVIVCLISLEVKLGYAYADAG